MTSKTSTSALQNVVNVTIPGTSFTFTPGWYLTIGGTLMYLAAGTRIGKFVAVFGGFAVMMQLIGIFGETTAATSSAGQTTTGPAGPAGPQSAAQTQPSAGPVGAAGPQG